MFFRKNENYLKTLIREGNLTKLKPIIGTSLTSDVTGTGMTLLHLAVKYENLDIINYLLNLEGIDVDSQDLSGTTPLVMAFREKCFKAAEILLETDARLDIPNKKGETPITYVLKYDLLSQKSLPLTHKFYVKWRDTIHSRTPKSVMLTVYGSIPLNVAVNYKSKEFLRQVLRNRTNISIAESRALVVDVIYSSDLNNLQLILTVGPDQTNVRRIFINELIFLIVGSYRDLNLAMAIIKQLIKWNLINQVLIDSLGKILETGDVPAVEMLLESGIVEYAKRYLLVDLTAQLFGNKNRIVMEVLRNRKFNVNAKSKKGTSALHFAVGAASKKNLKFLLEKGADVNIKDESGRTPLFHVCEGPGCSIANILLLNGADVQSLDNFGFFTFESHLGLSWTRRYILAHITLIEAQGLPISQEIHERIQSKEKRKKYYEKCQACIDLMKNYVVCHSVTMFKIITEDPKIIERHMRKNRGACKRAIYGHPLWGTKFDFNVSYYLHRFRNNAKMALRMCKLKNKALKLVAQSVQLYTSDYLIIHRIVDFLNYEDLCVIFK